MLSAYLFIGNPSRQHSTSYVVQFPSRPILSNHSQQQTHKTPKPTSTPASQTPEPHLAQPPTRHPTQPPT